MNCPFLSETRVKHCAASAHRKMIPLAAAAEQPDKCSTTAYPECAVYRSHAVPGAAVDRCPWLRDSLAQFCSASPVTRFVPYSESLLSRCGNGGYRYCPIYETMAHPAAAEMVDGIAAPGRLRYSANHFWLDVDEDGGCHAGIDAFLARVLGGVERLSFVPSRGRQRPAAVVTTHGMDLELVFPNPMEVAVCNVHLRAGAARLTGEPYGQGWLFQGRPAPETLARLMEGEAAQAWMHAEVLRMNEFVQQLRRVDGHELANDGGIFAPGLVNYLDRDQTLALFHEFFSPFASGKR